MPTTRTREATIKNRLLRLLNALPRCRAIAFPGTAGRGGEPDIFCCYQGRSYFFEVKAPGAPGVTALQAATLTKWQGAGAVALVVRSTQEALATLQDGGPPDAIHAFSCQGVTAWPDSGQ